MAGVDTVGVENFVSGKTQHWEQTTVKYDKTKIYALGEPSITELPPKQSSAYPSLTFLSHTNPVTGKMEWVVRDENYDYLQEIARY